MDDRHIPLLERMLCMEGVPNCRHSFIRGRLVLDWTRLILDSPLLLLLTYKEETYALLPKLDAARHFLLVFVR